MILIKSGEFKKKINAFLDSHPNKVLFDKEKLRNISSSNRKMSEILLSLRAIQGNQKSSHFDEVLPFSYVLYSTESKSYSHVKSISNILQGNSFFITLYGQQQCTRKILELMTNDKKKKKKKKKIFIFFSFFFKFKNVCYIRFPPTIDIKCHRLHYLVNIMYFFLNC